MLLDRSFCICQTSRKSTECFDFFAQNAKEGCIGALHSRKGPGKQYPSGLRDRHPSGARIIRLNASFHQAAPLQSTEHLRGHHLIGLRRPSNSDHRPNQWVYVGIGDLTLLNARQAKASTYISCDVNSEVLTEAEAAIYLDRIHGRWVVNRRSSKIETGE